MMIHNIFILSDGTGKTAELTVKAALTQFKETQCKLNIHPNIRTEKQIVKIVEETSASNGFIVHTVVSQNIRDKILLLGRLHNIETIDLMGHLLAQLSQQFSDSPTEKPGLFYELNKSYFQRIDAMEFAHHHDDGQKVEDLNQAEIVLLGVSRTFKTPLSIYLALKGWRVSNIPIIPGIDPPKILFKIKPERVFCLTALPFRLAELRKARSKYLGETVNYYASLDNVKYELNYALQLFHKHEKWSIIDVTDKPLEEIATEILQILRKKPRKK